MASNEIFKSSREIVLPYDLIFLTVAYTIFCLCIGFLIPQCAHMEASEGGNVECGKEGVNSTVLGWSTDFFVSIVLAMLAIHLSLKSSKGNFAGFIFFALVLAFLCKGFASRYCGNSGIDDGKGMSEFFVITLFQYLFWTISTVFLAFLVQSCWDQISEGARICGILETKIALALNILSGVVVATGCFWSTISLWKNVDETIDEFAANEKADSIPIQILKIGQLAWHGSYCLFLIAAAYVWYALSKEPAANTQLSRGYLAVYGILTAQIILVAFVVYYAIDDGSGKSRGWAVSKDSVAASILINYFMMLTFLFIHNLLLSFYPRILEATIPTHVRDDDKDDGEETDDIYSSGDDSKSNFEDEIVGLENEITMDSSTSGELATRGLFFFMIPKIRGERYAVMQELPEQTPVDNISAKSKTKPERMLNTHPITGPGGANIVIRSVSTATHSEEKTLLFGSLRERSFQKDKVIGEGKAGSFGMSITSLSPPCQNISHGAMDKRKTSFQTNEADMWNGAREGIEIPLESVHNCTTESLHQESEKDKNFEDEYNDVELGTERLKTIVSGACEPSLSLFDSREGTMCSKSMPDQYHNHRKTDLEAATMARSRNNPKMIDSKPIRNNNNARNSDVARNNGTSFMTFFKRIAKKNKESDPKTRDFTRKDSKGCLLESPVKKIVIGKSDAIEENEPIGDTLALARCEEVSVCKNGEFIEFCLENKLDLIYGNFTPMEGTGGDLKERPTNDSTPEDDGHNIVEENDLPHDSEDYSKNGIIPGPEVEITINDRMESFESQCNKEEFGVPKDVTGPEIEITIDEKMGSFDSQKDFSQSAFKEQIENVVAESITPISENINNTEIRVTENRVRIDSFFHAESNSFPLTKNTTSSEEGNIGEVDGASSFSDTKKQSTFSDTTASESAYTEPEMHNFEKALLHVWDMFEERAFETPKLRDLDGLSGEDSVENSTLAASECNYSYDTRSNYTNDYEDFNNEESSFEHNNVGISCSQSQSKNFCEKQTFDSQYSSSRSEEPVKISWTMVERQSAAIMGDAGLEVSTRSSRTANHSNRTSGQ